MIAPSVYVPPARRESGFMFALVGAALLHVLVWGEMARNVSVEDAHTTVQMLQVKLGAQDVEDSPPSAHSAPAPVERLMREQLVSGGVLSERTARTLDAQLATRKRVPQATPQRFVRERAPVDIPSRGHALGNRTQTGAEIVGSYAQTLALWLQRYKTYPEAARTAGMAGDAVVRIRIDRQGNVHYVSLRQKTGHAVLDAAVLGMVERANPLPPVPENYPVADAYLEFLIPISFMLGTL